MGMKANEFIKKHGWGAVIWLLESAPKSATVISGTTYKFFKQSKFLGVWMRVFCVGGIELVVTKFSKISNPIEIKELKRLVNLHKFIESRGGVDALIDSIAASVAATCGAMMPIAYDLMKDIKDVEACQ